MLRFVDDYDRRSISFQQLLSKLKALKAAVEGMTRFRDSFAEKWLAMEEVNAVALDEGRKLSAEDHLLVDVSIRQIRQLIQRELQALAANERST